MRRSDRQGLSEPFREGGDVDRETTRALGVVLPKVEHLEAEIFGDLREAVPHGIAWWSELAAEAAHTDWRSALCMCTEHYDEHG